MLGISLDVDKQQWKDAIKRDTLDWEQVCDFGGLNSEVAKQYSIYKIPANILLSSDGKIWFRWHPASRWQEANHKPSLLCGYRPVPYLQPGYWSAFYSH